MNAQHTSLQAIRRFFAAVALASVLLAALAAQAQHNKKNKKDQPPLNASELAVLPAEPQIDHNISDMMGAWQAGDTEAMHRYYADDATFVSGNYEPPVVGWQNYLVGYQAQRRRLGPLRLDRRNTYITVKGTIAWAAYQWDFNAAVDGIARYARGQTTLILEKRGDRWLIVHNHTSQICDTPGPAPSTASSPGAPASQRTN